MEERENSTRIPNWVMPVLLAATIALLGWTGKKVWDLSDQVLKHEMTLVQMASDVSELRRDHNSIVDMSADIRIIKDKMSDMQATLNNLVAKRP